MQRCLTHAGWSVLFESLKSVLTLVWDGDTSSLPPNGGAESCQLLVIASVFLPAALSVACW